MYTARSQASNSAPLCHHGGRPYCMPLTNVLNGGIHRPQLDPPHRATPPGRTASSRHGALFLVRDEGRASARPIDDGPVVPQQIAPDDTVALARTARAAPTAAEARTH